MRVSTTQFSLQPLQDEKHFWGRVETLIKQATLEQSAVILFPEYFSLSWLLKRKGEATFRKNLTRASELVPEFLAQFQSFADCYKIAIVAGTVPVNDQDQIFNRSYIFRSGVPVVSQDKINMTRFENEEWQVSQGASKLNVFTLGDCSCAVTTCYDVEFPAVTALAAEQGVDVLFVPSCTEDVHGYWRVRHCAQARAIENQCYVVMSSIVGGHPDWSEIESHYGQGGIYTPCDVGMPEGGVRKLGALNSEGLVTDEISKLELDRLRKNGTVLNLRDARFAK